MVKYIIIHNKHEGCYDYKVYEDEVSRLRLTSITINPPKIFLFDDKFQAQEFFEEYINDVDVIDVKCRNGDEIDHVDYCTCGIIELDDDENPILFYNKRNQIFLMEHGPQVFLPPQDIKNDIGNFNLTNRLIRRCRTLSREQRKKYIELGRMCQECNSPDDSDNEKEEVNKIIKEEQKPVVEEQPKPVFKEHPNPIVKQEVKVKPKVTRVKSKAATDSNENKETKPKEKKSVKKSTKEEKKDDSDNTKI
jgi:hypothetical protein